MTTFFAVTDTEKQLRIKKAHKVPINFIIFLLEKKPFPLTIRGLKFRFKLKTIMNDILQNPNSNSKKVDLSSKNQQKQTYNFNKLQKRLRRNVGKAIADFNMIEDGDRVMVCLSGGKDSYTLLDILLNLRLNAPINFEIVAVNLDQKQPGFPEHILPEYLQSIGVEYKIVEENTYGIVKEKIPEGKTTCSLCSRLRRGILYRTATELGATKIALGHHRDDMLETLFLNMFYGGKLKSMPPKLISDDGKQIVIRPLAYCKEKDIEKYSIAKQFPIIPCNLCGSQPNLQRQVVKEMLQKWDRQYPGRIETMFRAIQNITLSHLCDPKLFDFKGIKRGQIPEGVDGDIAFDKEDLPAIPTFMGEDEETTDFTAVQMISFKEVK